MLRPYRVQVRNDTMKLGYCGIIMMKHPAKVSLIKQPNLFLFFFYFGNRKNINPHKKLINWVNSSC